MLFLVNLNDHNFTEILLHRLSCGAMVARLTSNQKAAGSSPASGIYFCHFESLSLL